MTALKRNNVENSIWTGGFFPHIILLNWEASCGTHLMNRQQDQQSKSLYRFWDRSRRQEICECYQPVPQDALFWCFSLFFFSCSVFCNSCSNILALLFAPAQPKGCFANVGSAKLPSEQIFCPWVLAASGELVQVPISFPWNQPGSAVTTHTRNLL